MSGRTPSFIVVGLVIIMVLLLLFYASCSSKNTELRLSLEQFEERIRTLTIKNSDSEKKLENIISRKRELDEEKLTIQRQMEKKDSEINDLNTKLNEKLAEIQSLKTDKTVLNEQMKEYRSISDTLASKNLLIEKLQQELSEEKQARVGEFNRLKQEYDALKSSQSIQNNQPAAQTEPKASFIIPQQRFRPFPVENLTTKSLASLFQDRSNKLNNLTREVKAQMVPAGLVNQDKSGDVAVENKNTPTTTVSNEQQQNADNAKDRQEVNQNVPAPPLASNPQEQGQSMKQVEPVQAAPPVAKRSAEDNQVPGDNLPNKPHTEESTTVSAADGANIKSLDHIDQENDDEEHIGAENQQLNVAPPSSVVQQNNEDNNNYRIARRGRLRHKRDILPNQRGFNEPQSIHTGNGRYKGD